LTISGRMEARITSGIGRVVDESVAMSESSVWTVTRGLAAAEAIARVSMVCAKCLCLRNGFIYVRVLLELGFGLKF